MFVAALITAAILWQSAGPLDGSEEIEFVSQIDELAL
jgi:hypothetical protein